MQGKIETFEGEPGGNSSEEVSSGLALAPRTPPSTSLAANGQAEAELLSFLQYGRDEKPKKNGDLLELKVLQPLSYSPLATAQLPAPPH